MPITASAILVDRLSRIRPDGVSDRAGSGAVSTEPGASAEGKRGSLWSFAAGCGVRAFHLRPPLRWCPVRRHPAAIT
jgi:hypothetical protein